MSQSEKLENVEGYWKVVNSFDYSEFEKLFEDLKEEQYRDFIRTKIEHIVMSFPEGDIFYECPKCKHKVISNIKKPFFIDSLTSYFLEQTLVLASNKLIDARTWFVNEINRAALKLQHKFDVLDELDKLMDKKKG